ncbi:hypothetical protein KI387_018227, partial [Taxus chinensis]
MVDGGRRGDGDGEMSGGSQQVAALQASGGQFYRASWPQPIDWGTLGPYRPRIQGHRGAPPPPQAQGQWSQFTGQGVGPRGWVG